jgi:phosphatidylglycerophosphate synthase
LVVSASSSSHSVTSPNRVFTGALYLSRKQRTEIEKAVAEASTSKVAGHAIDLFLVALVRATIRVDAVELVAAPFVRSSDPEKRDETIKRMQTQSIPRLRLNLANRANDGFFSVFVLRRLSKILTWFAVRIRATPNQVTIASLAIGLYAAFLFAQGDSLSMLLGAVLLQFSLIVDCVDGELARYTRKFSELGAWLDAITDRVKEYAVYLGLAYGAQVHHGQNLWLMAAFMLALQTFRHLSDYNFSQVVKARDYEFELTPTPFLSNSDMREKINNGLNADVGYLRMRARYWMGKIITFPIGERWLVISVTAAVGGAFFTFTLLPLLAAFSLIWVYRSRFLKTIEMPKTRIQSKVISRQLDLGFPLRPLTRRLDWLEPSILRGLELGYLAILLATNSNLGVAGFVILMAISFHHYDNLYRAIQGQHKPDWLTIVGYTVLGRILIITVAVDRGIDLNLVAFYFAVWFFIVSPLQWVVGQRRKQP